MKIINPLVLIVVASLLVACTGRSDTHVSAATPQQAQAVSTGVIVLDIVDPERSDPVTANAQRGWRTRVYYPAESGAGSPYLAQALVRKLKDIGYYDQSAEVLDRWAVRNTSLRPGIPANISTRQRLVVLLPGLGVSGSNYALLAQKIVERGYVVAIPELPYLGSDFGPDGRWQGADLDPLLANGDQESWVPRFDEWTADLARLLSRLESAPELANLGLSIDASTVALAGHSLGGAVALHACPSDARIAVCMNFEGAPFGTRILEEGPVKPTLFVLSRSKREGEPSTPPSAEEPMFAFLAGGTGGPAWAVKVAGGSHMSFSDAPIVMPDTIARFGGEVMTADRSMEIYAGLVAQFVENTSGGGNGFADYLSSSPELLGTKLSE